MFYNINTSMFNWYDFTSRHCLVKVLGNIIYGKQKYKGNEYILNTDKIEILRELTKDEIININNNEYYLYFSLLYEQYDNNDERKLIFNKFIELKVVHSDNVYTDYNFIVKLLYKTEIERKLCFDRYVEESDTNRLLYFLDNNSYINKDETNIITNKLKLLENN